MLGTSDHMFAGYMAEFMWQNRQKILGHSMFEAFFCRRCDEFIRWMRVRDDPRGYVCKEEEEKRTVNYFYGEDYSFLNYCILLTSSCI
jgi:hypothetical protein